MSRAASKRAGESAEAAVIQRVDELDPAPGRSEHVDAAVSETIDPRKELPMVGLAVVERGTPVEIKSCGVVTTADQSRGRFYLRRQQHRHLVGESGVHLFAVTPPHGSEPLAMKIVPAVEIGDILPGWIEPDGRATYAQLAWSRVFGTEEVDRS